MTEYVNPKLIHFAVLLGAVYALNFYRHNS